MAAKPPYRVVPDERPKNASPNWRLRYTCPVAKRTKEVSLKTPDYGEALRRAPDEWAKIEAGFTAQAETHGDVNPNTLTMQGLFERLMMVKEMRKIGRLRQRAREEWDRYLAPTLAKMRVADLTVPFLEKLFRDIEQRKAPVAFKTKQGARTASLSGNSMYNLQSLVNDMGKLAKRKGWAPRFPLEFERYKRPKSDPDKWIDFEQRARVIDAALALPDHKSGDLNPDTLFALMVNVTGQRRTCIMKTEVDWCDPDSDDCHIRWSEYEKRQIEKMPETKKHYFDCYILESEPYRDVFLDVLRRAIREANARGSAFLFRDGVRGDNVLASHYRDFVKTLGADIAHITPHYGRSSYATNNIASGTMTTEEVADFIGDTPLTVARYYNKTPIEQRQRIHRENIRKRLAEAAKAEGATVVPFRKRQR